MFQINKQLSKLYSSSALSSLSLTGAWVAILSARGYTLMEIGIAETVFHITSILFEIPSGALADVFGRKKMLIVSSVMCMIGNIIMIFSDSLFMVCLSIAFQALCYNFSSGTGDALAYDSLKIAGMESSFEKYESNQLIIYRLCSGISTLCAGFALFMGYKMAYCIDMIICAVQMSILFSLCEVCAADTTEKSSRGMMELCSRLILCFRESFVFLSTEKKALGIMLCNSLVGAVDTLLLFFLQAKLLQKRIPQWELDLALFFMQMGGIIGAKLILKLPKPSYKRIFAVSTFLVLAGILAEHSSLYLVMAFGGFISSMGDDALQVRTNARLQSLFPSEQRATLTSMDSFCFSIVMIVLSPLAGIVFTYW